MIVGVAVGVSATAGVVGETVQTVEIWTYANEVVINIPASEGWAYSAEVVTQIPEAQ